MHAREEVSLMLGVDFIVSLHRFTVQQSTVVQYVFNLLWFKTLPYRRQPDVTVNDNLIFRNTS
jgi:hypothetical protein